MIVRFGMKMAGSVGRTVLHGQRRLCTSKFGVPKLIKNDEKCSFLGTQQTCRAHSSSGSSASIEKSLLGHLKEQYLQDAPASNTATPEGSVWIPAFQESGGNDRCIILS